MRPISAASYSAVQVPLPLQPWTSAGPLPMPGPQTRSPPTKIFHLGHPHPPQMTSQTPATVRPSQRTLLYTRLATPLTRFVTLAWPPSPALWLELPDQLLHQTFSFSSSSSLLLLLVSLFSTLASPLLSSSPYSHPSPNLHSRVCQIDLCRIWACSRCLRVCLRFLRLLNSNQAPSGRLGCVTPLPFASFSSRGASFVISLARLRLTTYSFTADHYTRFVSPTGRISTLRTRSPTAEL